MAVDLNRKQLVMLTASLRACFIVDAVEDPEGRSEGHMVWMLDRVRAGLDDETWDIGKANRWIGYVQAWLVIHFRSRLEAVKYAVRYHGEMQ